MIDNSECENLLIDQYIKLRLERCQQEGNYYDIVRLPFLIYIYCKNIFKRESHITEYLFKKIHYVFYCRENELPKTEREDEGSELYRRLLLATKDRKAYYVAQINVRCLLFGLSVKSGKKQINILKQNFKELINNLKIQLLFNCKQTLSELLLKELELMKSEFDLLEYYEELKTNFQIVDNIKIVQWIQTTLEFKRKQFQEKNQILLPYTTNQNNLKNAMETKQEINKIRDSPFQQKVKQKDTVIKQFPNKLTSKNSIGTKDIRSLTPNICEKKVSYISLANQQRKSVSGLSTRFSGKYIFKSTKKQAQTQIYEYYDQNSDKESPFELVYDQKIPYQQQYKKVNVLPSNNQQNSNFFVPATPPRPNKKVQIL